MHAAVAQIFTALRKAKIVLYLEWPKLYIIQAFHPNALRKVKIVYNFKPFWVQ